MNVETLIKSEALARPGYQLATFREAAIPVFLLTTKILTLDKKALNPIEEGCLRAVDAGLRTSSDVQKFLGLQPVVVNSVLASLNSQELINYARGSGQAEAWISLTAKGRGVVESSRLVISQEKIVRLVFDPLQRRVIAVHPNSLWKPREVKTAGRFEVPLCGAKRPEAEDIPLGDIDRVLELARKHDDESSELLALRKIERREMLFIPAVLLFFKANNSSDVQVAFYLDDGSSPEYERAFRELGGPEHIDAKAVLEAPDVYSGSADVVEAAARVEGRAASAEASGGGQHQSLNPTLRIIRCHEHPTILRAALAGSVERLLIISPWINHHIVDKDSFLLPLEALLKRDVSVYIGYGISASEGAQGKASGKPDITNRAKSDLEDLQARYKNFMFRVIGNTHRKVLVSDSKVAVTTSFNWLSFKGDSKMKPRDESGTLITKSEYVNEVFKDALDLLSRGYAHPVAST